MRKVTPIAFTLTKKHHDIVKRVAKKLKISSSEVIRRRIKSFDEMVHELQEDMKVAKHIPLNRM